MSPTPAEPRKQRYWKPEDDQLSDKDKLIAKVKRDPFIPIGFTGLLGAIGYGIYAYRTRGPAMTTSRYLMRLRVIAQSMVVGSIVVGVGVAQFRGDKDKK